MGVRKTWEGEGGVTKFSDTCIPPNKQIVIEIRALERVHMCEYFGHRFCFSLVEFPPPFLLSFPGLDETESEEKGTEMGKRMGMDIGAGS